MGRNTILVIVESPAKCKKIEKFLSKKKDFDWIVKASYGHITELKPGLKESIDINNNFKPSYQITDSKKKIINELSKISKQKNIEVIIATDPDREGEAIGYHLIKILNLDIKKTQRIFFNQITEKAVLNSLENPTKIDMNLVKAQQARCILDKLVGYEISPILWKHIKSGLSAGRCQSPSLRLLCEKEKEIQKFDKTSYFKLMGNFCFNKSQTLINFVCDKHFKDKENVVNLLNKFINDKFIIKEINKSKTKRNPSTPFTTSTLQQEASSLLNISPKDCMMVAQKLYENGYITYMRTDSIDLSTESKNNIKEYINTEYGKEFHYDEQKKGVRHKNKSKNSQEAHEAIRPVDINKLCVPDSLTTKGKKIYQLIWKRTIASQMTEHKLENFKIILESQNTKEIFTCSLDKTIFKGYSILNHSEENKDEKIIKLLEKNSIGDEMEYNNIKGEQKYTKPIPRYTEASLIKELEKMGIGRPSTYSTIISKIQEKLYVERKTIEGSKLEAIHIDLIDDIIKEKKETINYGGEKNKLFVTDIGLLVNDFLIEHFSDTNKNGIIDYNMTSEMEKELDKIAEGKLDWIQVIRKIYNNFHPKVEELSNTKSIQKEVYKKILGNDEDGLEIGITMGKDGLVLYKKSADFKTKWKFAPINNIEKVEEITLEDAKKELIYPKKIGKIDRKEVTIKKGKFGFYINYNKKNYSLQNYSPEKLDIEIAKKIITNDVNKEGNEEDIIGKYENKNIYFYTGKFGNYLSYDDKNFSINDKNLEKSDISLEMAIEIINKKNKLVIKEFNKELSIRIGKTGPYIMLKKGKGRPLFISIPKGIEVEKLTEKDCYNMTENK